MKREEKVPRDPDICASLKALRRAARRGLELGMRTGTPVYVLQNGKIIDLTRQKRTRVKTKLKKIN